MLLTAISLPTAISVCKCEAHTKSHSVSTGNAQADTAAKEAAEQANILKMSQLIDTPLAFLSQI